MGLGIRGEQHLDSGNNDRRLATSMFECTEGLQWNWPVPWDIGMKIQEAPDHALALFRDAFLVDVVARTVTHGSRALITPKNR